MTDVNEDPKSSENGIQVYIGEEITATGHEGLQRGHCRLMSLARESAEPSESSDRKRMDYEKVLKTLKHSDDAAGRHV